MPYILGSTPIARYLSPFVCFLHKPEAFHQDFHYTLYDSNCCLSLCKDNNDIAGRIDCITHAFLGLSADSLYDTSKTIENEAFLPDDQQIHCFNWHLGTVGIKNYLIDNILP